MILQVEKGKAFFLLPRGGNQNSSLIYRAAAAVMTGGNINEVGQNRRKSSNQNLLAAYPSITYTEQKRAYMATEEGVYDFEMELLYANHLVFALPCRLCVSDEQIYPPIQKVETDPKEVTLYTGSDQPVTVRAVVTPESVPPVGLIWQAKKEGIVEIVPGEDGTAAFKALTEGKTQVTVKEPGGKSAVVKVNVVEPVTEVTLSAKGKAVAGKTVTVSAALEPKKAGNKNLEWSLDVDESVATINAKGQVKIAKEAAAGTVITVTCKALGAPEPVIGTLRITVE